jgi:hypothetical protein
MRLGPFSRYFRSYPTDGMKVVVSGTQDVTTPSLVSGGYTVAMEAMRVLCLVASGKGVM